MKYKKILAASLLTFLLLFGLRAIFLLNQNPTNPNTPLLSRFTISDTAPYDVQESSDEINTLNDYSYRKEGNKLNIYVFSDWYCLGYLTLSKDTYPYKLFFKFYEIQKQTRLISVCPSEFTTKNLIGFLNAQAQFLDRGPKNYAILTLGYYDSIRTVAPQIQPEPLFETPSSFSSVNLSDIGNAFSYLKKKIFRKENHWSDNPQGSIKLMKEIAAITDKYIASYSKEKKGFNQSAHEVTRSILALDNIQAPLINSWENTFEQESQNPFIVLEQLVSAVAMYNIQYPLENDAENIFINIFQNHPQFFQYSKTLTEALLHYLFNISDLHAEEFLKKISPYLKQFPPPHIQMDLYSSPQSYPQVKEQIKKEKLANLSTVIKILKEHNVIPIITTYPFELPLFANEDLRQVAANNQVNLLDLPQALKERGLDESSLQTMGGHLNPHGAEIVAQIIYQRILELNAQ